MDSLDSCWSPEGPGPLGLRTESLGPSRDAFTGATICRCTFGSRVDAPAASTPHPVVGQPSCSFVTLAPTPLGIRPEFP